MRIGIGFYKSSREIKDKLHKEKDKLAFDIFDYLSDHAEWKATTETVQEMIVELEEGQLITSWRNIQDYLSSWGTKVGDRSIRNRLEKLQELGAIQIEHISKGKKKLGTIITVNHLTKSAEEEQKNSDAAHSTLEPQGIEQNSAAHFGENAAHNAAQNAAHSTLEPQGIEGKDAAQNAAHNAAPFLKNLKELKELKDLKDIKQQQRKITKNRSFVNIKNMADDDILKTAAQIANTSQIARNQFINNLIAKKFGYMPHGNFFEELDEIEKEIGFEVSCWAALQINASIRDPQGFFINTCNRLRQNGINNIQEAKQFATEWKEQNKNRYAKAAGSNRQPKPQIQSGKQFDLNF